MAAKQIALSRLAETTYARFAGPEHITETPFGRAARDPRCPTEWRFFAATCAGDEVDALHKTAGDCWPPEQLNRIIEGHDPATLIYLTAPLVEAGWKFFESSLMVYERPPQIEANPNVRIQIIDAATEALYYDVSGRNASPGAHEHRRLQDPRMGGERFLAWLENEPVGYGGWHVVDGLVRYRRLGTLAHARRQGVCTSMVRYVQDHPIVRSNEALVIGGGGNTTKLYERCGFVERGRGWMFVHLPQ